MSTARTHLTTVRRRGEDLAVAAANARLIRRLYMDEIEQRKRSHWSEFLDERDNTWKAYAFTKASKAGNGIPALRGTDAEVTDDRWKADFLLTSFFPVPPQPVA